MRRRMPSFEHTKPSAVLNIIELQRYTRGGGNDETELSASVALEAGYSLFIANTSGNGLGVSTATGR